MEELGGKFDRTKHGSLFLSVVLTRFLAGIIKFVLSPGFWLALPNLFYHQVFGMPYQILLAPGFHTSLQFFCWYAHEVFEFKTSLRIRMNVVSSEYLPKFRFSDTHLKLFTRRTAGP